MTQPAIPPNASRAYRRGILISLPMQVATVPFGMIFGALAIETGLDLIQTMSMTIIVVGGASQLVALQMLAEQAPPLLIVLTAALVNLRMAMYSAAIAAHWSGVGARPRMLASWFLNDQSFAISIRRYSDRPEMTPAERTAFFFGAGTCTLSFWIGASLAGALIGARLPADWPLEIAVPIVFVAIAAPMVRGWSKTAAAVTSVILAILLRDVPHSLGLIAAGFAGIGVGMTLERPKP